MRVDNSAQYQQTGDLPAATLPHPDNPHHTTDMNDGEATSATDKVLRLCQMSHVIPNLMNINSFVSQIHKMLILRTIACLREYVMSRHPFTCELNE